MVNNSDPTEAKLDVEHRLQVEEDSVAWLAEKIKQSADLTTTMTGVLTSFEERLTKLEATILPVYQETENLQRRQENIDKTLDALGDVINFYNVSKEVEATVKAGPSSSNNLMEFLETMSKLRSSLDYFEKSNPQSIELENIKALYETGGDALNREFGEMLKKHSLPTQGVELLNSISMPEEAVEVASIQHFPEDIQTSLSSIASWLNENNRDGFMNVYSVVRGQYMKKSLESLRDYVRASSGSKRSTASPSVLRKVTSPIVASEGTPTTSQKKYVKSISKKVSSVTSKLESASGISRRTHGTPIVEQTEHSIHEMDVKAFNLILSALQYLMSSEQQLMAGIIPHQYQKGIFEKISRESLDLVIRDSDAIISRVKKSSSNNDFLSIISVFQVVKHVHMLKPSMDRTLEASDLGIRGKYNKMTELFYITGSHGLDTFVDGIRADPTTKEKMPKDGTVFQLTSNVILFLEQIMEYVDTLAMILTQDTSYNQTLLRLPRKISVSDRNPALVGLYIRKVLVQLNLTLVNKSDYYADQFLKAVFRLNNNQYILKALQRSGLLAIVSLAEPDCEANYNDMIREQKMLYSQSFSRVLHYIWNAETDIPNAALLAPGRFNEKYSRVIKDKFEVWNKDFKEICMTQRMYSIPDVELRESLKRDNKEYVCPIYSRFYEKYHHLPFSKNPEKYVKYTPAEVSSQIDSFFDAAA